MSNETVRTGKVERENARKWRGLVTVALPPSWHHHQDGSSTAVYESTAHRSPEFKTQREAKAWVLARLKGGPKVVELYPNGANE